MIKKIQITAVLALVVFASCKKDAVQGTNSTKMPLSTREIAVPGNFNWENSSTVSVMVTVTDVRFQSMIHVISIFDADPGKGGRLIATGSARTGVAFSSKLYISKQVSSLFVRKTAPDNSTSIRQVTVSSPTLAVSIAE